MEKLNMIVPTSTKQKNEDLSANEFQEKLYNWLRDQGLITDLRGHLRKQMINVFHETGPIPRIVNANSTFSPKAQAMSTLVADFLLQQGNNYSLSIYITEVPIVGQLFSQFSQGSLKQTLETGHKFVPKDVEDILQTLGLTPASEIFAQSLQLYQNSGDVKRCEPLLMCIIRSISNIINRNGLDYINHKNISSSGGTGQLNRNKNQKELLGELLKEEEWLSKMDDSVKSNMKLCPITCLQEYMRSVHEEELSKVREEESSKYKQMLEEKLKEVQKNDFKERQLQEWKERMEKEFSERENNLCVLANQLRTQHAELAQKLVFLELESQEVKEKEQKIIEEQERGSTELKLRESEVELQQDKLNDAFNRLTADKVAIAKAQQDLLEKEVSTTKTYEAQKQEIECLKEIQNQYTALLELINDKQKSGVKQYTVSNASINTCDHFTTMAPKEDKGLQTNDTRNCSTYMSPRESESENLSRIKVEKDELSDVVVQQRQRIDELTMRAAELANQLQDAQIALQLVTPNRLAVTTPPLTAPPTARIIPRPNWPPHIGSGEETSFAAMRSPSNLLNNSLAPNNPQISNNFAHPQRRFTVDYRRRPRRPIVQSSKLPVTVAISSDDSSSTTDDMIREARNRLRTLEQESSSIQQNYEEFRARHNNFDTSLSAIFHPEQRRTQNPFDGFRETTYSSSFPSYPANNTSRNNRNFAARYAHLSRGNNIFYTGSTKRIVGKNDFFIDTRIGDEGGSSDMSSDDQYELRRKLPSPSGSTPIRTKSPTDLTEAVEPNLTKKLVENTLKNQSNPKKAVNKTIKNQKGCLEKNPSVANKIREVDYNEIFNLKPTIEDVSDDDVKNDRLNTKLCSSSDDTQAEPSELCKNGKSDVPAKRVNNVSFKIDNKIIPSGKESEQSMICQNNGYNRRKIKSVLESYNKLTLNNKEEDKNSKKNKSEQADKRCLNNCESNENISVEVLLQRSLRTSSSTMQQTHSEGEYYSTPTTDGSDSDKGYDKVIETAHSLPNRSTKLFLSNEDDSKAKSCKTEDFPRSSTTQATNITENTQDTSKTYWSSSAMNNEPSTKIENGTDIVSKLNKNSAGHDLVPLLSFSDTKINCSLSDDGVESKKKLVTKNVLNYDKDDSTHWREPGDGIENLTDSDDVVSAGTHISTSSEFW